MLNVWVNGRRVVGTNTLVTANILADPGEVVLHVGTVPSSFTTTAFTFATSLSP